MDYGLQRDWFPLHKDSKIRGRPAERAPIEKYEMAMFYLDNQQLSIDEMVRRIHSQQNKIYALARRRRQGAACYAITENGVHKRWP